MISIWSLLNTTSAPKAVPVLRWHHVQWQIVTRSGSPVALNRTEPHTQPPVFSATIPIPTFSQPKSRNRHMTAARCQSTHGLSGEIGYFQTGALVTIPLFPDERQRSLDLYLLWEGKVMADCKDSQSAQREERARCLRRRVICRRTHGANPRLLVGGAIAQRPTCSYGGAEPRRTSVGAAAGRPYEDPSRPPPGNDDRQ
jgi:hypothetical protein